MKILINAATNTIELDGVSHPVSLNLDTILEIEFDTVTGSGLIRNIYDSYYGIGRAQFAAYEPLILALQTTPEMSLQEAKLSQRDQINSARDTLEQSGFTYLNKPIDSDKVSVSRILSTSLAALLAMQQQQAFSIDWTCQDNTKLTLDAPATIGMLIALVTYAGQLHTHAKDKKTLIDAATTLAQVKAITW